MLIIRNPTNVFDTEEIQRGTLIYAKHKSWSKGEQRADGAVRWSGRV